MAVLRDTAYGSWAIIRCYNRCGEVSKYLSKGHWRVGRLRQRMNILCVALCQPIAGRPSGSGSYLVLGKFRYGQPRAKCPGRRMLLYWKFFNVSRCFDQPELSPRQGIFGGSTLYYAEYFCAFASVLCWADPSSIYAPRVLCSHRRILIGSTKCWENINETPLMSNMTPHQDVGKQSSHSGGFHTPRDLQNGLHHQTKQDSMLE